MFKAFVGMLCEDIKQRREEIASSKHNFNETNVAVSSGSAVQPHRKRKQVKDISTFMLSLGHT